VTTGKGGVFSLGTVNTEICLALKAILGQTAYVLFLRHCAFRALFFLHLGAEFSFLLPVIY
jgi:hypothetical protein